MRTAFLIGSLNRGGSERVLTNLADYFSKQGDQVTMVTQYQYENEYELNPNVKRIISDITEEETGRSRILNFIRRFRKLRNIWKQEKPEVILSFFGKNNLMSILTTRGLHIPVVVGVRAEPALEYYNTWMRIAAKQLFALADGVVLQTISCLSFFPPKVRKKAVILRNPINSEFFGIHSSEASENTIVAVGRVDQNKNHELLIRAFAAIAAKYPDYRVIVYGEGAERERLQKLVCELGLQEQISLPGAVSNVSEVIQKAGVFVLCSNSEGVPNTLIEAMVLGLPVISTDCPCGGPAELIEHGRNGLLFPVGDQIKLQENLQELLNNLQLAKKMGNEAKKTADIYKPETVYKSWFSYLHKISGGGAK